MPDSSDWAERVLAWFDRHGRHDLPWQNPRTPYRVWLSEIMLQQTTIQAVRPYFQRFLARFPDVESLAAASQDEVMALWSGLGYYARARNLHRAARQLVNDKLGEFPRSVAEWEALPGVGRSTAGAIVSQAFDEPAPVLDGNIKRLLARHTAEPAWPGQTAALKRLWHVAQDRLPECRAADYTQAMMDLGALVCTRRQPACPRCPVSRDCRALLTGREAELPVARPRRDRPLRRTCMWLLRNARGEILLERRPPTGIWGGLWSLPETAKNDAQPSLAGLELCGDGEHVATMRHEFTHFSLLIEAYRAGAVHTAVAEVQVRWFTPEDARQQGLPAPVARLLEDTLS